ncbi:serine/threonine-protein kinase/endoribonuclease IRE1-like [Lotus japonicus]|uniref:serine/threonine-protein kinase/endoribonuclease IRE1-like n=1 Tax=Lotus japonicus TaxID=34305 RepID=UPI00258F150F|nr:serine/threonine-protein kinase/endoribonuclease IRE1-like [Lotus japonicus]
MDMDMEMDNNPTRGPLIASHQVNIYNGNWKGREVAIKCPQDKRKAIEEINCYKANDHCQTIVRLHDYVENDGKLELILEKSTCSLMELFSFDTPLRPDHLENVHFERKLEFIKDFQKHDVWEDTWHVVGEKKYYGYPTPKLLNIIRDIVDAVVYLQKSEFRPNLDPNHILIFHDLRAKLLMSQSDAKGWKGPEIQRQQGKTTKHDMFGLGLLIYFCASKKGYHPFGEIESPDKCQRIINQMTRQTYNQMTRQTVLSNKAKIRISHSSEAQHLVNKLLQCDPEERPDVRHENKLLHTSFKKTELN